MKLLSNIERMSETMYAIIATLDETTNQKIRNLWQELKDMSLSDYAYQVRDREPHITLADFETIAVEEVLESLGDKLNLTLPLELSFQAIGSFLGSSIVFLGPTKTPGLAKLHKHIHDLLGQLVAVDSQYVPEVWIPHLTLANRIDEDKLTQVYAHCLNNLEMTRGQITAIKVIATDEQGQVKEVCQFTS